MVKPLLELCRVDPGDAFTYLSWSHMISRSNFRICFKIFSNFIFYAYFLKGYFKALPEKLFSAAKTKFFHRILQIVLSAQTMSTWSLEMFYDLAEQVFILVFDVWMRFRQNRSKFGNILHLVNHLSDELQWPAYKSSIAFSKPTAHFGDFRQYGSRAQNDNENLFSDIDLVK